MSDSESDNEEIANLRSELSTVPFCELQALQDKIGLKKFNSAFYGNVDISTVKNKLPLKRKNKNRPREMSSKRPVSIFKQAAPVAKKVNRDPRFDNLCGKFSKEHFERAYSFVDDIRSREKKEVKNAIKKEKDVNQKSKMNSLLQRMEQNEKTRNFNKLRREKIKQKREEDLALIKQGKRPFYLRKSEKKKLELAEKFNKLKESKKLERYLSKKRKRNATKQRKLLPKERL
ncbi:ribosomal RNA processing protein 36 homolog [Xenia sp. Carnegie-2017]|uniref:ribosomal RNA processing protein 36 homolog n=1 Tax=Xenia sp. Carnegie-2017 TaxID=2897299 RepID=UPI001F04755D|nr:ribosomal RNA processing protein 36 homolog [Xenia sp. Carnegie-2017]